jgi:hypothetical protein
MKKLLLGLLLGAIGFASTGTAQSTASASIEGRWTLSTGSWRLTEDLVISVDNDRIYGMLDDSQIRGTVDRGTFTFRAMPHPQRPTTVTGTVQADGTLSGDIYSTSPPDSDGKSIVQHTAWTAKRAVRR